MPKPTAKGYWKWLQDSKNGYGILEAFVVAAAIVVAIIPAQLFDSLADVHV